MDTFRQHTKLWQFYLFCTEICIMPRGNNEHLVMPEDEVYRISAPPNQKKRAAKIAQCHNFVPFTKYYDVTIFKSRSVRWIGDMLNVTGSIPNKVPRFLIAQISFNCAMAHGSTQPLFQYQYVWVRGEAINEYKMLVVKSLWKNTI
jgi:hypothetical protein